MDKNILIEYADTREEIKDLRIRIEKGMRELDRLNDMVVADTVTCGKKGKRALQVVKIEGVPTEAVKRKRLACERNMELLEDLEADLLEQQTQVEEYIQQIERSELRIMFRLCFIDDLSYPKVAMVMNDIFPKRKVKYTDENIKKRIQRFFDNVPLSPGKEC